MNIPEKGDLVYLNFNPQAGHRPAIVLSPKLFNSGKFAVVCPITNREKGYPFEVKIPDGNQITGVILTDQIRSLDWRSRNLKIVGNAPEDIVQECLDKISTFIYNFLA
jgi:mRNA interferase MazF